jgi:hypothetical protein
VQQVAVAAGRHDPAGADEGDQVDPVQQQRAGRRDDRGAARALLPQPGRDPRLGVRVDRRGRLDENQDLRIGGQRPGQHQPLPLPAGERTAALGDDLVDRAIEAIEKAANTGKIGDGKIFVFDLLQVVRIRTGETGASAL